MYFLQSISLVSPGVRLYAPRYWLAPELPGQHIYNPLEGDEVSVLGPLLFERLW